jgi:hypothetical protein
MSEQTQEWTPENICEVCGFVSAAEPNFYASIGELVLKICDAHNAALAAEREETKRQHEGWVRADKATTVIYHEYEKLKQQLAAEREKRDDFQLGKARCEKQLDATVQELAAEREKCTVTCQQRDDFRRALEQRVFELDELREQLKQT